MTAMAYTTPVWWGRVELELNQRRGWNLAGMELVATRAAREWRLQVQRPPQQHEEHQQWSPLEQLLPEEAPASRFFFKETHPGLHLLPRLADRSVVVKPVDPLFIPPGQEVTLYVSTPVWLACYVEELHAPLLDVPVIRPSDTWFGSGSIRGEVCYATRVLGRTDLSQFPPRPFRAVTPVTVHNGGISNLPLERINIPVPYLPLYAAENGRLWTPTLHVRKDPGPQPPRLRIDQGISPLAGNVVCLTLPRNEQGEHTFIRMFDTFF